MAVPKIRFPGFTDAWEQRKLGDVLEITTRLNNDNEYDKQDVLSVSDEYGLINQIKFQGRSFAANDVSGYKKVQPDDIVYTRSPLALKPYGIIKKSFSEAGIISPLYIVNTVKEGNDSTFLYYNFDSPEKTNNYLKPLVRMGAKHTMNISNDEWLSGEIWITSEEEQKKIGKFFRLFDNALTLHQRKLESMKLLKKSLLQKMFPKSGETVPEVRFPGFTDAWEQRKLGNCFAERSERSGEGELIAVTINSGVVRASELDRKDNSSLDKSNYKIVREGDIAYNSMRMWQGASGYSHYDGILSPAYTVLIPKTGIDSKFFAYVFKRTSTIRTFQTRSQGLTSDTWNLKYPELSNIEVMVPRLSEQQHISVFFETLDSSITLHQRKVEILHKLKKSLLQQMFV